MEKPIPVTKKPIPVTIPIPFTGGQKDIAFVKAEAAKDIAARDREIEHLRKQNAALKKGPLALSFGK